MAYYPHHFEGTLVCHDVGSERYRYTVVWLPDEIAAVLPLKQYPRLRITGEANEIELRAALTPVRGRWYILFSAKALKAMGVAVGDDLSIVFAIDDQNAVEIPDALATTIFEEAAFAALWAQQTPGKQRGFGVRVAAAKSPETQAKRIAEVRDIMEGRRDFRGNWIADLD